MPNVTFWRSWVQTGTAARSAAKPRTATQEKARGPLGTPTSDRHCCAIGPGDPEGRASMAGILNGEVIHLPERDPLTLVVVGGPEGR